MKGTVKTIAARPLMRLARLNTGTNVRYQHDMIQTP